MHRGVRAATAAIMRGPLRHVLRPIITAADRVLSRLSGDRLQVSAPMIPSLTLVRARLLGPAEAEQTWPVLERQWPHSRDYEKTARRDIRIFALEPR